LPFIIIIVGIGDEFIFGSSDVITSRERAPEKLGAKITEVICSWDVLIGPLLIFKIIHPLAFFKFETHDLLLFRPKLFSTKVLEKSFKYAKDSRGAFVVISSKKLFSGPQIMKLNIQPLKELTSRPQCIEQMNVG
jgi:hypothetical protein